MDVIATALVDENLALNLDFPEDEEFTVDGYEEYEQLGEDKKKRRQRILRSRRKASKKNSGESIARVVGLDVSDMSRKEKTKFLKAVVSERKEYCRRDVTQKQLRRELMRRELADSAGYEIEYVAENSDSDTELKSEDLVAECTDVTKMFIEFYNKVASMGYDTSAKIIKDLIIDYSVAFDFSN